MSARLWRIAQDTPDYVAEDMGGVGASKTGGRWNREGTPVVYAASTISLATLETLAHLNAGDLPLNRYLVEIEVPDLVWDRRIVVKPPVGWEARPPGKVSLDLGTDWLIGLTSALLVVPSVIVPEEHNVLINPKHPDASGITAKKLRSLRFDDRFLAVGHKPTTRKK